MSSTYTALYRKLRPARFSGIFGQEHIVRTLKNQIMGGRVSHAYLFCGTHGTGKTTTAKIFSRAVNCQSPADGEPCGECSSCVDILGGSSMNVLEIDAASNNGVDNIREIRGEVAYTPTQGNYRVYIIDEVHMLSTGAFNALLKTLEEPPAHVIFILATTDPQRIPATIHSRCQRFDFRRISTETITQALEGYALKEGIDAEPEALRCIAGLADGAMRDAVSLLDQCVSFYFGERVNAQKVQDISGSVGGEAYFRLCSALIGRDIDGCLDIIENFFMQGRDAAQFVSGLLGHLRNLLVALAAPEPSPDESAQKLAEQATMFGADTLIRHIGAFSDLQNRMKYSSDARILLEVCCIGLCRPASAAKLSGAEAMKRLEEIEGELSRLKAQPAATTAPSPAEPAPVKAPPAPSESPPPPRKKAVPDDIRQALRGWKGFAAGFSGRLSGFMKTASAGCLDDGALYIACNTRIDLEQLDQRRDEILERLRKTFGKEFDLRIVTREDYDKRHRTLYGGGDDFDYGDFDALLADMNFQPDFTGEGGERGGDR